MKHKFNMEDPEVRVKSIEAKRRAREARGGVSAAHLVTLATAEALLATGRPVDHVAIATLTGANPGTVYSRLRTLAQAGFLTRTDRYAPYQRTDKPINMDALKNAHKRAIRDASDAVLRQAALARRDAPATPVATSDSKALRTLKKALAPFARYGERVKDQNPDTVPTLIRKDGITNADFQAAYAALGAALEETEAHEAAETHPVSGDMSRYL